MKFPTKFSHYGWGWLDKIYQGYHPGIDYNNGKPYEDEGQEVVSICDGEVQYIACDSGWGWHIIVHHKKFNIWSHYAHLQNACIKKGDSVKENQLIGLLGGTGGDWPPHLHFEIRLQDFSPNRYVTGLSIKQIEKKYTNPEIWFKKHNAEVPIPSKDVPVAEAKSINPLLEKLKGKIVLQVQSHGEAWYICPVDGKRYYLKNGDEAYRIMSKLGFGITTNDL